MLRTNDPVLFLPFVFSHPPLYLKHSLAACKRSKVTFLSLFFLLLFFFNFNRAHECHERSLLSDGPSYEGRVLSPSSLYHLFSSLVASFNWLFNATHEKSIQSYPCNCILLHSIQFNAVRVNCMQSMKHFSTHSLTQVQLDHLNACCSWVARLEFTFTNH